MGGRGRLRLLRSVMACILLPFEEKQDCLRGQYPFAFIAMIQHRENFRDESLEPDFDEVSSATPRANHLKGITLAD